MNTCLNNWNWNYNWTLVHLWLDSTALVALLSTTKHGSFIYDHNPLPSQSFVTNSYESWKYSKNGNIIDLWEGNFFLWVTQKKGTHHRFFKHALKIAWGNWDMVQCFYFVGQKKLHGICIILFSKLFVKNLKATWRKTILYMIKYSGLGMLERRNKKLHPNWSIIHFNIPFCSSYFRI